MFSFIKPKTFITGGAIFATVAAASALVYYRENIKMYYNFAKQILAIASTINKQKEINQAADKPFDE